MNKKPLWITSLLIFILYLLFWNWYVKPFDFSGFFEAVDFIAVFILPHLLGFALTLLISFIPFRNLNYGSRLGLYYPLCLVLMCMLFALSFYLRGPNYSSLKTVPGTDCKSVHDGVFITKDVLIERKGGVQIQTDLETNKKEEMTVTWLSDCEYQLGWADTFANVKIISVDKEGYECHVWQNNRTTQKIKVLWKTKPIENK